MKKDLSAIKGDGSHILPIIGSFPGAGRENEQEGGSE
jgi:hypothetical protein